MPRALKKQRAVFPIEEYKSESEEEMEDEFIGQTIDVDFDAFKAEDGDFDGIKLLLQQTFRGLDIDISGIADIIISQNYVGSVIKQAYEDENSDEDDMDDAEQIFGLSSVINLTSRKDEEPVAKLRSALVEKCQQYGSDSTNQLVRESLGNESKHVGLLLSERLVNLPPKFAVPVFESLVKEIALSKKKDMPYDFTYFVMICKIYKQKVKKNKTQKERLQSVPPAEEIMWSNAEEEIFYEESVASFEYDVKGDTGLTGDWEEDDAQYAPCRRVVILNANQLTDIISKVKQET